MGVQTLGEAWKLGWRARAHCIWFGPNKSGTRRVPWCDTTTDLDMKTLVWTRGERMPLADLAFEFSSESRYGDHALFTATKSVRAFA
jgi:hypothetical protein